jgi:hypothetical protein
MRLAVSLQANLEGQENVIALEAIIGIVFIEPFRHELRGES